jgi:hypothetical protein
MLKQYKFFIIGWIFFALLFFAISYFTPDKENVCIIMRDFFQADVKNGVIVEKFVDAKNHAIKTVIIEDNERRYKVIFVPYDNWVDFERLTVGDTLSKPVNSFKFFGKNGEDFQLHFDCDYSGK